MVNGARLDPQMQAFLRLIEGRPKLHQVGLKRARSEYRRASDIFDRPPRSVRSVRDDVVGGCPVRVYQHEPSSNTLLYFHGGGFVIGDLESHDVLCRRICRDAKCTVIAVHYPRGPEAPFPAAQDAAVTVFRALVGEAARFGVDPARIAVGGDSAGGQLSAFVSHQTRADVHAPCFSWLIYPTVDMLRLVRCGGELDDGFLLDRDLLDWFSARYFESAPARDEPGVTLIADDLHGLPPTHVVTAGFDPLKEEGAEYVTALREAGVSATLRLYPSLIHGFVTMTRCRAADHAVEEMIARLASAW